MYPKDYNGFDQSTMHDGVKGDVRRYRIERIESDAMIKIVFTVQLLIYFNLHSIRHSFI